MELEKPECLVRTKQKRMSLGSSQVFRRPNVKRVGVGLPGDYHLGKGSLVGTWTKDATIQVMNTREGAQPGALKTSPKKSVSFTICQTQRLCWKTTSH